MSAKKFLAAVFCLVLFNMGGQTVSGKITDSLNVPVPFCAVALIDASDSGIVKGSICKDDGSFEIMAPTSGKFMLMAGTIGFGNTYSEPFLLDSVAQVNLKPLVLKGTAVKLNEISISAVRNPLEFKNGNIVVDIEGSPLSVGNSAYELLTKLPGVMVDNDDITVQGQGGVRVYVDDRIQQMTGSQLINFLRSLNASSIEKIEVIVNPPAKYDAAGSGAIINIVTKRAKITGISGNINYTYSKGYSATNVGGVSLNYKGNKVNVFSSVSFYEGRLRNEVIFDRDFVSDSNTVELRERSAETDQARYLTINLGADWFVNKKNTVGFKIQGVPGAAARTFKGDIFADAGNPDYSHLNYTRSMHNTWFYGNYNINAEHVFDTLGTKLKFSADYYNPYTDVYNENYNTHFMDDSGKDLLPPYEFRTENTIGINITSAKLDFEKKLSQTIELTAGVKASYQDIFSDYKFENRNFQGLYIIDSAFTNRFSYKELINAAYANIEKQLKKVNFSLGIRAENTEIQTNSLNKSIRYTRQYVNVFPLFSVNYNRSPSHIFSLFGNTRIHRPDYNSFNPYRSFNNLLVSSTGNPFLFPEYHYNIGLNYVYKGAISNNFSYNYTRNPILGYPVQNDSTRETIFQIKNIDHINHYRYVFFVRKDIRKWWTSSLNIGAYYLDLTGQVEGSAFFTSAIPWWIWGNNQFILKNDFKIEVMAFYWSPWLGGVSKMQERWAVDLAIKKSFFKNKLNLSVALADIFFSKPFRTVTDFRNQHSYRYEASDSRRLNISASYNFGKVKVEQRNVQAGDEEKARMGR